MPLWRISRAFRRLLFEKASVQIQERVFRSSVCGKALVFGEVVLRVTGQNQGTCGRSIVHALQKTVWDLHFDIVNISYLDIRKSLQLVFLPQANLFFSPDLICSDKKTATDRSQLFMMTYFENDWRTLFIPQLPI